MAPLSAAVHKVVERDRMLNSKTMTIALYILGVYHFLTGVFAYFGGGLFYALFVSHTGSFNPHFMADIGAAYMGAGLGLILAARIEKWRVPFAVPAVLFLGLHSLIHVVEIITGQLTNMQSTADMVTIIMPTAFVLLVVYVSNKMATKS